MVGRLPSGLKIQPLEWIAPREWQSGLDDLDGETYEPVCPSRNVVLPLGLGQQPIRGIRPARARPTVPFRARATKIVIRNNPRRQTGKEAEGPTRPDATPFKMREEEGGGLQVSELSSNVGNVLRSKF